jgi:deoxyribose-phosphate aldolase
MAKLGFQTSAPVEQELDIGAFARNFDHTNLKPTSGKREIEQLCKEAAEHRFAAVCIAPRWVAISANLLSGLGANSVRVCTVVGFPHGNTTSEGKAFETTHAIAGGASEIDMVISIGDLKDRNERAVEHDIAAVVEAARLRQAIVKVILETAYLEKDEIVLGCGLAVRAGADFVKTSTGFGSGGADVDIVRLMRETVGDTVGVKAAGGVRTLSDARRMLNAGATRLGCSSSVQIMHELGDEVATEPHVQSRL